MDGNTNDTHACTPEAVHTAAQGTEEPVVALNASRSTRPLDHVETDDDVNVEDRSPVASHVAISTDPRQCDAAGRSLSVALLSEEQRARFESPMVQAALKLHATMARESVLFSVFTCVRNRKYDYGEFSYDESIAAESAASWIEERVVYYVGYGLDMVIRAPRVDETKGALQIACDNARVDAWCRLRDVLTEARIGSVAIGGT